MDKKNIKGRGNAKKAWLLTKQDIKELSFAYNLPIEEFYSFIEETALSPYQILILELFDKLSDEAQDIAIKMIQNMV